MLGAADFGVRRQVMTASRNRVLFRPVIPLALVTGLLGVGLIGTAGCTKSTAAPATGNVDVQVDVTRASE